MEKKRQAGTAKISRDRAKIDALCKPMFKTWFTGGKEHNRAIAMAKIVAGAITGRTLDDSVQGTLRV